MQIGAEGVDRPRPRGGCISGRNLPAPGDLLGFEADPAGASPTRGGSGNTRRIWPSIVS